MHLKSWRDDAGLTRAQFAEQIGRTAEAVRRYEEGERIPDRETMPLIVSATGGAVMPNDFFSLPALCTVCDHRLEDGTIRACGERSCPHAQREAA